MAGRNPNARSRDMLISMAVLIVPVLALVWLFSQDGDARPAAIDVAPVLERAQAESPYPVLHAEGLGEGWTPVRADWARTGDPFVTSEPALGNSWQLGYLSPDEIYYGILQRDSAPDSLITDTTREGTAVGEDAAIGGREWQRYESKDGRTRSLVHRDGELTAVVSADTDFADLEAFAASLVEAQPAG